MINPNPVSETPGGLGVADDSPSRNQINISNETSLFSQVEAAQQQGSIVETNSAESLLPKVSP
jgi:hypothetical protein